MKHLDYRLDFEERDTCLFVRISGRDSFAASLSYWNEIADKVKELGAEKLLVQEQLIGSVSEEEMFDLIGDLQGSVLRDVQIAFCDETLSDEAINDFGRRLANEKGAHVRIFRTLRDAEESLR